MIAGYRSNNKKVADENEIFCYMLKSLAFATTKDGKKTALKLKG